MNIGIYGLQEMNFGVLISARAVECLVCVCMIAQLFVLHCIVFYSKHLTASLKTVIRLHFKSSIIIKVTCLLRDCACMTVTYEEMMFHYLIMLF